MKESLSLMGFAIYGALIGAAFGYVGTMPESKPVEMQWTFCCIGR